MATSTMPMLAVRQPAPRYSPRRHLWLNPGEPLVCPNGHKLRHNAAILDHDAVICQHREGKQGECGARVYVLAMPKGLRFVAEVTTREMLFMRDEAMSLPDALKFLGAA